MHFGERRVYVKDRMEHSLLLIIEKKIQSAFRSISFFKNKHRGRTASQHQFYISGISFNLLDAYSKVYKIRGLCIFHERDIQLFESIVELNNCQIDQSSDWVLFVLTQYESLYLRELLKFQLDATGFFVQKTDCKLNSRIMTLKLISHWFH